MEIIPSINVTSQEDFDSYVQAIDGLVDRVHLDIADGIFVPNKTIEGYEQLQKIDTDMAWGVHLMVSKPENHIAHWANTPADKFIFHIEATQQPKAVIDAIKELDGQVGIALNPETPTEEIDEFIDQIDFVHFLTVEPGFNGADFIVDVVEKMQDFHYMYPDVAIEVDGAITPQTAVQVRDAGASLFVAGSYVFENKKLSPEDAIAQLRQAIE